jgi:hypothetical protein
LVLLDLKIFVNDGIMIFAPFLVQPVNLLCSVRK